MPPTESARTVLLRLPRMHPPMMLPAALLALLMLPFAVLAAAVAVAAGIVGGIAYPTLTYLHRAFVAAVAYQPRKAVAS